MQIMKAGSGRRWLSAFLTLLLALALCVAMTVPAQAATVKVGADGKAPSGLAVGTQVVTGGGTYTITGKNADGSYKSTLTNSSQTTSNYSGSYSSGSSSSSSSRSSGSSSRSSGSSSSSSSSSSSTSGTTVRVGSDGKAPSGLSAGTQVVTAGGTYTITKVNADGSYKSTLTNSSQTTSNYKGTYSNSGGSSSGSSGSLSKTNSTVVVGANGKAPSGLPVGTQVVTGGGTYTITGVNKDGTYSSVLTNKDQTTYNYTSSGSGGQNKVYSANSQSQTGTTLQAISQSNLSDEEKISQALSYLGYENNEVNRAAMEATLGGYNDGSYDGGKLIMEGGNIISYTVNLDGTYDVKVSFSYDGAVDLNSPEAQAALKTIIAAKEDFAAAQNRPGVTEAELQALNDAANAARENLGYSGGYNGNYYLTNDAPATPASSGGSSSGSGRSLFYRYYTISASAGIGGSISPSGDVSVRRGGSQSFSIKANSGYAVLAVYVDGVNVGAKTSYSFRSVKANHTIVAAFQVKDETKIPSYTITATAGEGGYISPSGRVTVKEGGNASFMISSAYGYGIDKVIVDGVDVGSVGGYGFTNILRDHTISVSFKKIALPPTLEASGVMRPSDTIKSGLGVEASVTAEVENCTVTTVTATYSDGTTITLEKQSDKWVLPVNPDSKTGARKHYIPIDWPDNSDFSVTYLVTAEDAEGNVITDTAEDSVLVVGSMYDDDQTTHD